MVHSSPVCARRSVLVASLQADVNAIKTETEADVHVFVYVE